MAALPRLQKSTKTLKEKGSQFELAVILPGCAGNTTAPGKQRIPARIPARLPRCVPEKLRSSARGLEPQRPAARLGLIQGFLNFWVFVFFALNGQVLSQKSSVGVKFQERKEFLSQFLFSGQNTGLAAFYGFGSHLYGTINPYFLGGQFPEVRQFANMILQNKEVIVTTKQQSIQVNVNDCLPMDVVTLIDVF